MARRQGAAGRRRAAQGVGSAQVVVHHLDQARAALAAAAELGCALELRSAPGAAGYAGVGYLKALGEEVGHELLIDCGDDAGLVMAALRAGCRRIVFSGSAELGRRLADMAEQLRAALAVEAQAPEVIMLQPEDDAAAVLRACACGAQ
jgi:DNA-binding NarL/FixJ family response regulator